MPAAISSDQDVEKAISICVRSSKVIFSFFFLFFWCGKKSFSEGFSSEDVLLGLSIIIDLEQRSRMLIGGCAPMKYLRKAVQESA